MTRENLYVDDKVRVAYNPLMGDEHILFVRDTPQDEELEYLVQRGLLEDFAKTPRGELVKKLANVYAGSVGMLLNHLQQEGVTVDGLHVAFCQAYAEEERQIRMFTMEENASRAISQAADDAAGLSDAAKLSSNFYNPSE